MRWHTGSQWSVCSATVTWSRGRRSRTNRAAAWSTWRCLHSLVHALWLVEVGLGTARICPIVPLWRWCLLHDSVNVMQEFVHIAKMRVCVVSLFLPYSLRGMVKTATNQNGDRSKRRHQNGDCPKRRQVKTATNLNGDRSTERSPKRRQTKKSTLPHSTNAEKSN